jgi:hypothetical protein
MNDAHRMRLTQNGSGIMNEIVKVVSIIMFGLGSVVSVLGLLYLGLYLGWCILGQLSRYKHEYIKDHKEEFRKWGRRYNRERKRGGN